MAANDPNATPGSRAAAAQDPESTAHIDVNDSASLKRWAQALGTTDEALMNAVKEVGPRIDKIKDYLGQGGMAGDQSAG